jgi:class 3 adenylate cyclase
MPTFLPGELGEPREIDLALLIADLSGYTAFTETHGALHASEIVLRFQRLAGASLEPGVAIINSIGDDVFCAGADTLAVVKTALRLRDEVERQPEFPNIRTGVNFGRIVEREHQLFGGAINLTARVAAFARGGQILCTEPIARAVREVADLEARAIGEHRFRNVAYPVTIFDLARVNGVAGAKAIDPVCRMQIGIAHAVATIAHAGATYHFCSLKCAGDFANAPEIYLGTG